MNLNTELHYLKKLGYDREEILDMTPVERLVFQLTISDIEKELNQAQLDSINQ